MELFKGWLGLDALIRGRYLDKEDVNFRWEMVEHNLKRGFQDSHEENWKVYWGLINNLHFNGFVTVWMGRNLFSLTQLLLYTWMNRGFDAKFVFWTSAQRVNVIATQWSKKAFYY